MALMFIHVLYIQTDAGWYAQCLDVDVGAQGATQEQAEEAFFATWRLQAQIDIANGRKPFEGLGQAPPEYQAMLHDKKLRWEHKDLELEADEDSGPDVTAMPPPYMLAAWLAKRDSMPSSSG